MKIYIGSRFAPEARESCEVLASKLEAMGHTITHKWWDAVKNEKFPWPTDIKDRTPAWAATLTGAEVVGMTRASTADVNGAATCDIMIVRVPTPPASSIGLWIEMGVAVGRGKKIFLVGEDGNAPYMGSIFSVLGHQTSEANMLPLFEALAPPKEARP